MKGEKVPEISFTDAVWPSEALFIIKVIVADGFGLFDFPYS